MFKLIKLLVLFGLGYLLYSNPTLESGIEEVNRRATERESTTRAAWNTVSDATGIDWLGKQAGLGVYELCRKNLYLGSLFVVREAGSEDAKDQIAYGVGVAGQIKGEQISMPSDVMQGYLAKALQPIASNVSFNECHEFKMKGKMVW